METSHDTGRGKAPALMARERPVMQEYTGNAINLSLIEDMRGDLQAFAEIIILTSEPVFKADEAGQIIRQRAMSNFRFGVTEDRLEKLIESLTMYKKEMSALKERASLVPEAE